MIFLKLVSGILKTQIHELLANDIYFTFIHQNVMKVELCSLVSAFKT